MASLVSSREEEIQDELRNGVSDVWLQPKDAPQAQGANAQGTVL